MTISHYSRLKGSFIGLAIGDAMGAPLEFMRPGEFTPVTGFVAGGAHNVRPGEWTDDMAMALCIADAIIKNKGDMILSDILDNFVLWHEEGKFSSRGQCFDIGGTCARALRSYKKTKSIVAPTNGEHESGNGSLMRMAPVIFMFHHDLETLIQKCLESSRTTHTSSIVDKSVTHFATILFNIFQGMNKHEAIKGYTPNPNATPTGFVVDSLDVAVMAFRETNSFEEGLLHVVNQGEDSDTVGAIYSQIAGAYYGYESIPEKWRREVWERGMLEDVFNKLYALTGNKDENHSKSL